MKKNLPPSLCTGPKFSTPPPTPHTPNPTPLTVLRSYGLTVFFLLAPFFLLPSSAQSYTVFSCDFENWTDGKPDGWTTDSISRPFTLSPYTPAYSGTKACSAKFLKGGMLGGAGGSGNMVSTESFPIYWGKKYVLSFTAKVIKETPVNDFVDLNFHFKCTYENSHGGNVDFYKLKDKYSNSKVRIAGEEWHNYEIEFIPHLHSYNGATTNIMHPTSSICVLHIGTDFPNNDGGGSGNVFLIFDNIKLIAKDHTMEFDYLSANNIKTYIDPIVPFQNWPQFDINYFEAPKGSGKSTIFTSNLWLGGLDDTAGLHVAAQRFCQRGFDFWLGPQTTDYFVVPDSNGAQHYGYHKEFSEAFIQKYYHTWKVTNSQIYYHRTHYKDANYVMPWAIANWPAHGRPEFGESANLAPFIDVNKNGKYEPLLGDYPDIFGDQAVFFILNDLGPQKWLKQQGGEVPFHTESGGKPLGIEILGMAFAFGSSDEALQNTIFLSYELRNRSANNYKDFYFGFWTDFEIGYGLDDYVGCDTTLNMMYAYNGMAIDGSGEAWAYGENPPAQGAIFLNQKMSTFLYFDNMDTPNGDPNVAQDYYNMLRAIWRDGTHLTMGGNGYKTDGEETNFMFSDALYKGAPWNELTPSGAGSEPNCPYDRRGMMSCGPFSLKKGESLTVDIALPFARDESGKKGALNSLALLKNIMAPTLQEYYEEGLENFVGIKENKTIESKVFVYPNPSSGSFTLACKQNIESIEIYDLLGKMVFSDTPKVQITQINTHLPQGFYIYKALLQDKTVSSGKIVVE